MIYFRSSKEKIVFFFMLFYYSLPLPDISDVVPELASYPAFETI